MLRRMMMLDLQSLACFEAAATLLSFRAASQQVSLSPAAFSDRIRRLEEDLGERLFDRSTRRVNLTRAGLRLLPQARRCLDEARACVAAIGEGRSAPFELTIGTRFELGMSWLVPNLTALERERPERKLHLYFADSPDLMTRLERGGLDAIVSSVRLVQAGLDYVTLHTEEYVFVATPTLLERHALEGPTDAVNHVLLDISADLPLFRYFLDGWRGADPWNFCGREYLGTIGAIRHRALESVGVAVLPTYFVGADISAGRLQRILPKFPLANDAFRLVWRGGHRFAAEMLPLAEALRSRPLQ